MAKYGDFIIRKCANEKVCDWYKDTQIGFCHLMAGENKHCKVACCDSDNCNSGDSWPAGHVDVVV